MAEFSLMRARAVLLLGPGLVLAAVLAPVRATNFGGHDEWLVLWMVRRGIASFPYAQRPLALLGLLPAGRLVPDGPAGCLLLHALYLAATGALTAWMARRWLRLPVAVALLAGVAAAVWAPADQARLDSVLAARYTAFALGAFTASALFVAAWRRTLRRRTASAGALLAAGAVLAVVMASGQEAALAVMAAAPLVAWCARPADLRRRPHAAVALTLAWEALLTLATLPLLRAMRSARGYQYQVATGFDPRPLRVAARLARQLALAFLPAVRPAARELLVPTAALAAAALAALWLALGPSGLPPAGRRLRAARRRLARALALGLALAGMGWLPFTLSALVAGGGRTQIFSAPGTGLALAALVGLLASALPRRAAGAALALAGCWIAAVAAGRTAALQRQWDAESFWSGQSGTLVQLVALAPAARPNTLLLLIDGHDTWRASYSFRHAVHLLYGPEVVGAVWNGIPFLYPLHVGPDGLHVEPMPAIRGPWGVSPTVHAADEVVALRLEPDGRLRVLQEWPPDLPALAGAPYRPRARLVEGSAARPPAWLHAAGR